MKGLAILIERKEIGKVVAVSILLREKANGMQKQGCVSAMAWLLALFRHPDSGRLGESQAIYTVVEPLLIPCNQA
jgi:hypothetical protein